ncbi:MAG TPA: protein phosphatase 2C domain-containing protein [Allosphingosinicella sp.]|nr:protein phosphatase 2C domain-containing protein [Allosphingosinicella sp.]
MASGKLHRCWARTHVGHVREANEDVCAVPGWTSRGDDDSWHGAIAGDGGWALVADGMGGHAAGEVASALAVAFLAPLMPTLADAADAAWALAGANAALHEAMARDPALGGMGTTMVGAVLHGDTALVFNLGDSRAYLMTDSRLAQISNDHALGGHILTRYLGGGTAAAFEPSVARVAVMPGARLLLCSDGLTNMVGDDGIARLLASGSPDPADALVRAALDAGGVDNVSVVVVEL